MNKKGVEAGRAPQPRPHARAASPTRFGGKAKHPEVPSPPTGVRCKSAAAAAAAAHAEFAASAAALGSARDATLVLLGIDLIVTVMNLRFVHHAHMACVLPLHSGFFALSGCACCDGLSNR